MATELHDNVDIQENKDSEVDNEVKIENKPDTIDNPDDNNESKTTKEKENKKNTLILATREYTDEELTALIRKKYSNHNQYFKVLKTIVNNICDKELAELNNAMKSLENLITNSKDLPMKELEKHVIQIPIFMYKLNAKLAEQGLNMEISAHLNNYEITETLMNIHGGTAQERLRAAEYKTMVSTFTLLVKNRVYYNIKNNLDYSSKVYDGLKKVLSAQIEELKVFGKEYSVR